MHCSTGTQRQQERCTRTHNEFQGHYDVVSSHLSMFSRVGSAWLFSLLTARAGSPLQSFAALPLASSFQKASKRPDTHVSCRPRPNSAPQQSAGCSSSGQYWAHGVSAEAFHPTNQAEMQTQILWCLECVATNRFCHLVSVFSEIQPGQLCNSRINLLRYDQQTIDG
jgi:hypothetical protein